MTPNKIKMFKYRLSKAIFYFLSLFLVAFGSYFVCYPIPSVEFLPSNLYLWSRVAYFMMCATVGILLFLGFVILVYGDYENGDKKDDKN